MLQQQLENILQSLPLLQVGAWLALLFVLLILGSFWKKAHAYLPWAAMLGLGVGLSLLWNIPQEASTAMLGMLHNEASRFFHILPIASGILALWLGYWDRERPWKPTATALLVFMVLGAHLLLLSAHALPFYLSVEMLSIGAYILTAQSLKKHQVEAGIKYLIFGSVASASMLYGISLLYGGAGSLYLRDLLCVQFTGDSALLSNLGLLLMTGGLLFKLAAVPLHIWAPDVYQSVPSSVAAFFSTAPKAAGVVVLMRWAGWIPAEMDFWPKMMAFVAIASMLIGNVSAFWQKSSKRLLAYSSIAHAGFMLVPVVSSTGQMGAHDLLLAFYLGVYVMMNYAAFASVQIIETQNGDDLLTSFSGRGREFPLWGVLMLVTALSLVGLPVTAGFTAKMLVFSGLWESYQQTMEGWHLALLIIGLANTVLALFYYLKIPYFMFFKDEQTPDTPSIPPAVEFSLILIGGALLLFFFKPDWLWWA